MRVPPGQNLVAAVYSTLCGQVSPCTGTCLPAKFDIHPSNPALACSEPAGGLPRPFRLFRRPWFHGDRHPCTRHAWDALGGLTTGGTPPTGCLGSGELGELVCKSFGCSQVGQPEIPLSVHRFPAGSATRHPWEASPLVAPLPQGAWARVSFVNMCPENLGAPKWVSQKSL